MKVQAGVLAHRIHGEIASTHVLDNRYDGDACNYMMAVDNFMAEGLMDLRPFKSGLDLEEPRKLSRNLLQTKPVVAMTANYFQHRHHEPLSQQQEQFMKTLSRW